jgi:hypothetical protein
MTRRVTTIEERIALLEAAPPPTSDDVTILPDGRRLDSREAVMAWLGEDAIARLEGGAPRTLDDGRCLDSSEAVEAWLAEDVAAWQARIAAHE